jgi:Ca2+-binding RTX toxin-like protein
MSSHEASRGTAGDDVLISTRGGVFAFAGNDTIMATAQDDLTQIHTYAATGDDLTFLDFAAIFGFAHGHHVRGGSGEDSFDFINIDNVSGFVVGRIEDFDIRSDEILIEGMPLDFSDLPDTVRVVSYNGDHDDPGALPQPWLHISTAAGGDIFYALEGARVDMDQADAQEPHFLKEPVDPRALPEIEYVSPNNYLPDDHDPVNGLVIEDTDLNRDDVIENIFGSDFDDLIAAGLNDDDVFAGAGNDNIFAGSGNDVVVGGAGHDRIEGATGNDLIDGGSGRDDLTGGEGEDLFVFADFDRGFDVIRDFVPGTDQIVIEHDGMADLADLRFIRFNYEDTPSALIRFLGDDGAVDKSMGGVVLKGVMPDDLSETDFIFGLPLPAEAEEDDAAPAPLDPIVGTRASEQLGGTDATDLLYGLGGRDTIDAGDGNDLVDGGAGRDDLTGGEGEDLFVFADFERGFDVIRDFVPGTDQIVIDHEGMEAVENLRFIRFNYEDTPSTLIRFLGEDGAVDKSMGGIVLKGVMKGELSEGDFIFGEPQLPVAEQEETAPASPELEDADIIDALFIRYEDRDAALMDQAGHSEEENEDGHSMEHVF